MLSDIIPQITTVFALAAAYFGFGIWVLNGNLKLVEGIDPVQQIDQYLQEMGNHRKLIYRWFFTGFAAVAIVIGLLVFQSMMDSQRLILQADKLHLEQVIVELKDDIKDFETELHSLEIELADVQQKLNEARMEILSYQARNPDFVLNTLRNG